jgi:parallel beta-helix repeat protein
MKHSVLLVFSFFWLAASFAESDTKRHVCGTHHHQTLQRAIDRLDPGDTLLVSGTCNENVVIGEGRRNLTIEARGPATINGSGNAAVPAVLIRGRGIVIKGFTIIGGRHGVQIIRGGSSTVDGNLIRNAVAHGISVHSNSFAQIVDNTIENNGANGICVCEHAVADIGFRGDFSTQASPNVVRNNGTNGIIVADASYAEIESNSIHGNASAGIVVNNSSSAKIGAQSGIAGTFAGANTIESNGNRGILVTRSSSAQVVENIIRNNTGDGVVVVRAAHADIAANAIDGNTGDGILINNNSGVNLGSDSGGAPQDLPNNTITNNAGFGIRCLNNSSADGRLGTLNGNSGPQSFAPSCVNSLIP